MTAVRRIHRMPFGAEPLALAAGGGGVRFRLWAPGSHRVQVCLESGPGAGAQLALDARPGGWHESVAPAAGAGSRYRYCLADGALVPDPASRFQPDGPAGASEVVDPEAFAWPDREWRGRPWREAVVYELHVGAFDPDGGYAGVARHLDHLAGLGVTAIELMPLAECPGAHNWGYDGVLPFAPASRYGRPEALKALVADAHARGLMVLLDVVYNHFGPEGNTLPRIAPAFFTDRFETPWGSAIDFTQRPVRDFFVANALYWLEEYHLDGLRLDAVHAIRDPSPVHVLDELAARVRARFRDERHVHLVLENDANEADRLARDERGRPRRYTAQWNDDGHHALHVLLTGEHGGYYADYAERPVEHLGRALAEGFAWQGEPSPHRGGARRGEPSGHLAPTAFVLFLQNHDQIGNRAFGERMVRLAPREAVDAALAVLLLSPQVPLLFMGEEWGADEPFPFFCDFEPPLADAVRDGRRREFASFPAFRDAAARDRIPDPCAPATFESARLHWRALETPAARARLARVRELLAVRAADIAPRLVEAPAAPVRARWTAPGGRELRVVWTLPDGSRLHLLAHLGAEARPQTRALAPGRLLHATPEDLPVRLPDGGLPPWSVGWTLEVPPVVGRAEGWRA